MNAIGHLRAARPSTEAARQGRSDVERLGFVMNATRLWAHLPSAKQSLFDLMATAAQGASLTHRQQAVLVTAAASTLGDPYCSLAWGSRLADRAGTDVATAVVGRRDHQLVDEDRVLAEWVRKVVGDPMGTTERDVDVLRDAGFSDEAIFALTAFIALRVTFSMVNDSLGARPDPEFLDRAPDDLVRSLESVAPRLTSR